MNPAPRWRRFALLVLVVGALVVSAAPAYAQHGNYLLGTLGLLGGAQAPEGIYYQNVFSYYHGSEFQSVSAGRARSLEVFRQQLGLSASANLNVKSDLDAYVIHQVSSVHTRAITSALKIDPARTPLIFPTRGNIGPASIPVALAQTAPDLTSDDRVACMGIGSGLNAAVIEIAW